MSNNLTSALSSFPWLLLMWVIMPQEYIETSFQMFPFDAYSFFGMVFFGGSLAFVVACVWDFITWIKNETSY